MAAERHGGEVEAVPRTTGHAGGRSKGRSIGTGGGLGGRVALGADFAVHHAQPEVRTIANIRIVGYHDQGQASRLRASSSSTSRPEVVSRLPWFIGQQHLAGCITMERAMATRWR